MDATIKKEWVEALRSGKYKQNRGGLRDGDKFCCLGVLCDLVKDRVGGGWSGNGFISEASASVSTPTSDVAELCGWGLTDAGLQIVNPIVAGGTIASHNDRGATFAAIADLIEQHL